MSELLNTDFLPSDPADRKRIQDAVEEASGLKQIQKDKADQIKDIIDFLYDEFSIPKKISRQMVNTFHKDNYSDVSREHTVFEVTYETIFPATESN